MFFPTLTPRSCVMGQTSHVELLIPGPAATLPVRADGSKLQVTVRCHAALRAFVCYIQGRGSWRRSRLAEAIPALQAGDNSKR